MKSAHFYKCLEKGLVSTLQSSGFQRLKGRTSRWSLSLEKGHLFLCFRVNGKYPWTPFGGGTFTTEAFYSTTDDQRVDDLESNPNSWVAFFSYCSSSMLDRFHGLNRSMLQKIANLDLTQIIEHMNEAEEAREVIRGLHSDTQEIILMDLEGIELNTTNNPNQYYYDEDDVYRWAKWLKDMLPAFVFGINEKVILPFKQG